MESEAPTVPVDATPTETNGAPTPYYAGCPSCRVTLPIYPGFGQAPIYAGLHTRWLGSFIILYLLYYNYLLSFIHYKSSQQMCMHDYDRAVEKSMCR